MRFRFVLFEILTYQNRNPKRVSILLHKRTYESAFDFKREYNVDLIYCRLKADVYLLDWVKKKKNKIN